MNPQTRHLRLYWFSFFCVTQLWGYKGTYWFKQVPVPWLSTSSWEIKLSLSHKTAFVLCKTTVINYLNINLPSIHAEQRSQMAISLLRVRTSGFHTKVNFELVIHFKFKLILRVIWTQQQYLLYLEEIKYILQLVAPRKFYCLSYSGLLPLGL